MSRRRSLVPTMSTAATVDANGAQHRATLWALLFGNFVVGTGILLPAGMLNELASGLNVSVPAAGSLMLVSGIVVAIGAPLFAAFTSRADRRLLLVACMVLYAIAHLISAFARDLNMLLIARVAIGVSAAIYTPQAAATVGALLPPENRSSAITMIFVGWSLATVAGIPLGGFVAHALGWPTALLIVAALSVIGALLVWLTVPAGVRIAPLNGHSWRQVASSPALLLVLLVTVLNGTGQFTLFTYVSPSLKASLNAETGLLTAVLAWFGVWATTGNVIATKLVSRIGAGRAADVTLAAMALGLTAWGFGAHTLWAVMAAAALWGLGNFATNSVQQARLAGLAPELTSASIALNTSAIYLGQASGSALGGALIKADAMATLPFAAAGIMLLALAVSVVAGRQTAP